MNLKNNKKKNLKNIYKPHRRRLCIFGYRLFVYILEALTSLYSHHILPLLESIAIAKKLPQKGSLRLTTAQGLKNDPPKSSKGLIGT